MLNTVVVALTRSPKHVGGRGMIEELPDILYVYSILACTLPILGSDGYLTVVTYAWPYTI